jgi:hypothetical protein
MYLRKSQFFLNFKRRCFKTTPLGTLFKPTRESVSELQENRFQNYARTVFKQSVSNLKRAGFKSALETDSKLPCTVKKAN